ncbi:hypothetical protein [Maridesulfovibrio hydrothermalis]|uniref:Uncharacterized protein n=1 Tax=Maridesulfovibrio hydrothermalis AM13 = DSM 14728 TaxID=1121451 RepID=L0R7B8_9BACT|nr:hypothetical protein [Maridesulfovibrio hydrothermalis]CCO22634.1 conserved exported protein of unknown function [Maridesulfovibrio hydrothermalis AM13 = DSM 14728]
MTKKNKKIFFLFTGLAVFAILGVVIFNAAGFNKPPRPRLADGFQFKKGISASELNLTDHEVHKLNGSLRRNRGIVEKAILTVLDAGSEPYPDEKSRSSELKFSLALKGKNGMIFAPDNVFCARQKLVKEIVSNVDRGAKILVTYSAEPILKGKDVIIVDM